MEASIRVIDQPPVQTVAASQSLAQRSEVTKAQPGVSPPCRLTRERELGRPGDVTGRYPGKQTKRRGPSGGAYEVSNESQLDAATSLALRIAPPDVQPGMQIGGGEEDGLAQVWPAQDRLKPTTQRDRIRSDGMRKGIRLAESPRRSEALAPTPEDLQRKEGRTQHEELGRTDLLDAAGRGHSVHRDPATGAPILGADYRRCCTGPLRKRNRDRRGRLDSRCFHARSRKVQQRFASREPVQEGLP